MTCFVDGLGYLMQDVSKDSKTQFIKSRMKMKSRNRE